MTPLPDGRWQLRSAGEADAAANTFDQVVVAAGAWARRLLDPLGLPLALESQRGYHVQFDGGRDTVSRTVVLADRKVFVTPMEDGLRVGGTVEFGGLARPPDPRRAAILERIARETFGGLEALSSTHVDGPPALHARFGAGHRPRGRPARPVARRRPRAPGPHRFHQHRAAHRRRHVQGVTFVPRRWPGR